MEAVGADATPDATPDAAPPAGAAAEQRKGAQDAARLLAFAAAQLGPLRHRLLADGHRASAAALEEAVQVRGCPAAWRLRRLREN